ncbi:alcohol dehydrogenase class-3-like [Oppia nitens]|uniref:alcohol dehydrogenase class-3-like n=1 Tax=Oppia nitens TaxID=1686743 RepID=UPI0023DCE1A6|nr:alcohol dehydrogenase class-3-like [Oppia nitens]
METKRIKCKAAVAYGPKQSLCVEDIYVNPPKNGEIRVQIIGSSICRSDLHIIDTNIANDFTFPLIMGHEGSGIVESVGPDVTDIKIGDHVIPLWIPNCMKCKLCNSNKTNFCQKGTQETMNVMPDGTTRFWTMDEKPIYKSIGCAAFSEYTVMPIESVIVINKNVNLEKVCLIGCCVVTGYGNVVNVAKVEKDSSVAVFGLGAIGLAVILAAKECGAKRIIGVDVNEDKFSVANNFGCNEFVNPMKLPKGFHSIQQLFQSYGGLDYTFECIGSVSVIQTAFESLNRWGICVVVGLPPKGEEVSINPWNLLTGQKLTGSFYGGYKPREGIQYLVDKYMRGDLNLDLFITNKIKLQDINNGFDLMRNGKTIRTVIVFDK